MSAKKTTDGMNDTFTSTHIDEDANGVFAPNTKSVSKYDILSMIKSPTVNAVNRYFPSFTRSVIGLQI